MTEAFVRHESGVQYLTSPLLDAHGVPHLFSLRGGGVSIDPVRSVGQDGIDACRFCEMRAVCRFEGRARTLQPMRAEQFWEVVIGKENGHG